MVELVSEVEEEKVSLARRVTPRMKPSIFDRMATRARMTARARNNMKPRIWNTVYLNLFMTSESRTYQTMAAAKPLSLKMRKSGMQTRRKR